VSVAMNPQRYSWVRAFAGYAALGLGCIGLSLFVLGIPIILFGAYFWGGFGFREGPQPTPDQLNAAVSKEFWWAVWHRLVPLLVISGGLVAYGFYATRKKRSKEPQL
jgi:hypothetical protein